MKHRIIITSLLILIISISISGCKEEYIHVGDAWNSLYKLKPPEKTFKVNASGKRNVRPGDTLSFKVTSEKPGKLWMVQVDPDDRLSVLFPNEKMNDNTIAAHTPLYIPPRDADWAIEADEVTGKSIVAFIVTTGDISIGDVLSSGKDIEKALRLVETSDEWGIEKLVIDTK